LSSPIGHSLAGYLIYIFTSDQDRHRSQGGISPLKRLKPTHLGMFLAFVVIANMPDLDFLPGLFINEPNRYHHGISHSLGAAVLISGMIALLCKAAPFRTFGVTFVSAMALYSSHLALDMLCLDARPPLGIPLFWPISNNYLQVPVLPPVRHALLDHASIGKFIADAFSIHNLMVVLTECFLAGMIVLIWGLLKKWIRI
jgi:inner membrane protein